MIRPGQTIVLCVLALLTLGVVMVNSAGMSLDPAAAVTVESILLSRSTVYAGLAVLAMAIFAFVPVTRLAEGGVLRNISPVAGLCAGVLVLLVFLMLVYTPVIGHSVNGSARWIRVPGVPGLTMQPSEIVKWGLVALIAWYAARSASHIDRFRSGLLPALLAIGLVGLMVVAEDLGTGVLIVCASVTILIAAGARLWQFALLAPAGLALVVMAIVTNPYRLERIRAFVDPFGDPEGRGYHMIQSMIAVANGNITGRGLGHGLQKFGYLPEDTTDFLFAIIAEELGIAGAALVIVLLGGLLWAGLSVARAQQHLGLKLFAIGVIATVGIQAAINLVVVTGLGPTKGIALPLVSSGGTGWILTAGCLGVLVSMDRTSALRMRRRTRDQADSDTGEFDHDDFDTDALPA